MNCFVEHFKSSKKFRKFDHGNDAFSLNPSVVRPRGGECLRLFIPKLRHLQMLVRKHAHYIGLSLSHWVCSKVRSEDWHSTRFRKMCKIECIPCVDIVELCVEKSSARENGQHSREAPFKDSAVSRSVLKKLIRIFRTSRDESNTGTGTGNCRCNKTG
jgi:hypothetical protein